MCGRGTKDIVRGCGTANVVDSAEGLCFWVYERAIHGLMPMDSDHLQ